mgnify:CR=1 FL=1
MAAEGAISVLCMYYLRRGRMADAVGCDRAWTALAAKADRALGRAAPEVLEQPRWQRSTVIGAASATLGVKVYAVYAFDAAFC